MISEKFIDRRISVREEIRELRVKDASAIRMQKAEIPSPKQTSYSLHKTFPDDITDVVSAELGTYLGVYESEASWTRYCIARREIDLDHGRLLLGFVYDKLADALRQTSKLKPTELKTAVNADLFYVESKMEVLEIEADLKLLYASLEAFERYAKAISREITNRQSDQGNFPKNRSTTPSQEGVFNDHSS